MGKANDLLELTEARMFTAKHYVAIAKLLKDNGADKKLVDAFANMFSKDTPEFDERKFHFATKPGSK